MLHISLCLKDTLILPTSMLDRYKHVAMHCTYVTGFAKRGLPRTSNFVYLKDCNFLLMNGMNLKFSHNVLLCFIMFYTKFQFNISLRWKVMNCQTLKIGCVWKTPFRKSSHICVLCIFMFLCIHV